MSAILARTNPDYPSSHTPSLETLRENVTKANKQFQDRMKAARRTQGEEYVKRYNEAIRDYNQIVRLRNEAAQEKKAIEKQANEGLLALAARCEYAEADRQYYNTSSVYHERKEAASTRLSLALREWEKRKGALPEEERLVRQYHDRETGKMVDRDPNTKEPYTTKYKQDIQTARKELHNEREKEVQEALAARDAYAKAMTLERRARSSQGNLDHRSEEIYTAKENLRHFNAKNDGWPYTPEMERRYKALKAEVAKIREGYVADLRSAGQLPVYKRQLRLAEEKWNAFKGVLSSEEQDVERLYDPMTGESYAKTMQAAEKKGITREAAFTARDNLAKASAAIKNTPAYSPNRSAVERELIAAHKEWKSLQAVLPPKERQGWERYYKNGEPLYARRRTGGNSTPEQASNPTPNPETLTNPPASSNSTRFPSRESVPTPTTYTPSGQFYSI